MEYKYDNSKDVLAHIMRKHGADVLLGRKLKSFFNDYAPDIKGAQKNVIFLVCDSEAAKILKRKIAAEAEEQETAFRQAVQKVIDEYAVERSCAESIMLEFTAALGWKINVHPAPTLQKQETSAQSQERLTIGQRNVRFGKYLWRVLDVQNGKALLLAEDILEERLFHSLNTDVTWETCELRGYLSGTFFQTFSSQEQSQIALTVNTNADNPWYGTRGGSNTADSVFLLSLEEVVKYFGDSGDLQARKGWYYKGRKYVLKDGKGYSINDQYNSERIANYGNEGAWWWLRSPGHDGGYNAANVNFDGSIDVGALCRVSFRDRHWDGGVRPALWLNL